MRRMPLALQITLALLLVLGIALGFGFYPALVLESRQLEREREAGLINLASSVTLNVAAMARGEIDEDTFVASMTRLFSVPQLKRQIVSLDIASRDPFPSISWLNPDLAYLKSAERRVLIQRPAAKGSDTEGGGPQAPTAFYPDVQTVRVLVKGEQKEDLAMITLEVSMLKAKAQMAQLKRRQASALGLAVVLILGTSLLVIRQISNPVQKLIGAMDRLAGGDFDVDLKPTGAREIRRLASAFNQMALELKEKERLRMELQAAKAVQTYLLPREIPRLEGYALDGLCVPASEVGGDFYQFFSDGSGGLSFVIGDVSGKGMKAAMLTSLTLGALHSIVKDTHEPVAVLSKLNSVLCDEIQDRSFVTCLFGHLDPANGTFSFGNAGHLYPYHYSAESGAWSEIVLPLDRFPAGLLRDARYHGGAVVMKGGDVLLLLSDGIVEARNERRDIFGDELLIKALESAGDRERSQIGPYLAGRVASFQGGAQQADDITIMTIHREVSHG